MIHDTNNVQSVRTHFYPVAGSRVQLKIRAGWKMRKKEKKKTLEDTFLAYPYH